MIETNGDLFAIQADAIVITTNGDVNRRGLAVMGRGVAYQAKQRYPKLAEHLGLQLKDGGNHVHVVRWNLLEEKHIVSFPVKHHWHEEAAPELIDRSCGELVALVNQWKWSRVALPRPGCGNGGLDWMMVRPILTWYLDDRFYIVNR